MSSRRRYSRRRREHEAGSQESRPRPQKPPAEEAADAGLEHIRDWGMTRAFSVLFRVVGAAVILFALVSGLAALDFEQLDNKLFLAAWFTALLAPLVWGACMLLLAEALDWMVHMAVHTRGQHVALQQLLLELRKEPEAGEDYELEEITGAS